MQATNNASNRLLLIDGFNIVRRVYGAIPGDDSDDKAAGALKASLSAFHRLIREVNPTHFLAAFDAGGETWRHRLYEYYKAERKPIPEPLRLAMPAFYDQLNSSGLRTVALPDIEAEDALATIALKAVGRGFEVGLVTNDKDAVVLMHHGVKIRDFPKQSEWFPDQYAQEKFGVPAYLMPDLLGLVGDSVDGIPGVAGVGAKTAPKLLNIHGNIEGVLAAAAADLDPIPGAVGSSLRAGADIARLSKRLATLKIDVPMNLSPNDILIPEAFIESLAPKKTASAPSNATPHDNSADTPHSPARRRARA